MKTTLAEIVKIIDALESFHGPLYQNNTNTWIHYINTKGQIVFSILREFITI
jgi:hypothetical protein